MHTPSTLPRRRNRSTWSLTIALAMVVMGLAVPPAHAAHGCGGTVWVDALVTTPGDGCTLATAVRTIPEGVGHAGPGGVVNVVAGVYEGVVLVPAGVRLKGVAAPSGRNAVASPSPVVSGCTPWAGVVRGPVVLQGDGAAVEGLTLVPASYNNSWAAVLVGGTSADPVDGAAIVCNSIHAEQTGVQTTAILSTYAASGQSARTLLIERNFVTNVYTAIYLNRGTSGTVDRNTLERASLAALSTDSSDTLAITRNTVRDSANGVVLDALGPDTFLSRNAFSGIAQAALKVAGTTAVPAFRNWWGHSAGPRTSPPANADGAAQQLTVGPVLIDPWCRDPGCGADWVKLTGTVKSLNGGAIDGAQVTIDGTGATPAPKATTNASGDYSLTFPVTGSTVTLKVTDAYCTTYQALVNVPDTGVVEGSFPRPTALRGVSFHVFDKAYPATNKLNGQFTVTPASGAATSGATGTDGVCDLPLPEGSYTVSVTADRYLPSGPLSLTVPAAGATSVFDVPLDFDEALAAISGSVQRGGTDTPIGGATVTATAAGQTTKTATSAADGSFALQLTPDKDWTLSATASGYHPSTLAAIKPARHEQRGGVRILMLTDRSGGGDTGTVAPRPTPTPTPTPTTPPNGSQPIPDEKGERVSGSDRAGTAVAVSMSTFEPGTPVVYVATSGGFADALAGGPAAARQRGPILLVERDRVPDSTLAELRRLAPQRVVVLGGSGVISDGVAAQLDAELPVVDRLSGSDRFATAAAVSRATFPVGPPVAYIATGGGFADALSGGAAAALGRGPVLLVDGGAIPAPTAEELRRLGPRRIVVLGGESAVPAAVLAELDAYTEGTVQRLSGPDRYATSAAIADATFPPGVDTVYVATGENFPDALAGVPAAGRDRAPLLLVQRDAVPEPVASQLRRLSPRRIVILGGSGAVSAQTEHTLASFATG